MSKKFEAKPNTGALFKNKDKKTDNHPDYNGKLNVGGKDFYLSAWLKTAQDGAKYMSLSIKQKGAPSTDLNDDIGF